MTGKVALVGAGLGDPELLTLKGQRKLAQADVVVYDRLINPAMLNLCKSSCEKIYVGKRPNHHSVPQAKIAEIMIAKALQGYQVVRLKSGDPYVFGRGGEEGLALKQAGISFEVIPGVTSAIGGLAYAGIPITYRGVAASLHIYTGHLKNAKQTVDWQTAAKAEGTLVFLMGMAELSEITQQLIAHGKQADTPAAIIQWASRQQQQTVVGTLETIHAEASAAKLQPPCLIVIGEVVLQRAYLNFFEERPLFSVSITLPYTEEKRLTSQLTDLGAEVIELPPASKEIFVQPIDFANTQQLVFTDQISVEMFLQTMKVAKKDWRQLAHMQIFTVGRGAEKFLTQMGILSDHYYATLADCIQTLAAADTTLFLGDARTIHCLEKAKVAGSKQISHAEKIIGSIPDLWQQTNLLCFPNAKSARLFLNALNASELAMLQKQKVIVMGEQTKAVFADYHIPVRQTHDSSYASVVKKIQEEMNL